MELEELASPKLIEVQGQPGNDVKKASVENAATPEGSSSAEDTFSHEKLQHATVSDYDCSGLDLGKIARREYKKVAEKRAQEIKNAWVENFAKLEAEVVKFKPNIKWDFKAYEPTDAECATYAEIIFPDGDKQRVPVKMLPPLTPSNTYK